MLLSCRKQKRSARQYSRYESSTRRAKITLPGTKPRSRLASLRKAPKQSHGPLASSSRNFVFNSFALRYGCVVVRLFRVGRIDPTKGTTSTRHVIGKSAAV